VVIPVCVQGAGIPNPQGLPEPLAPMTERQGFELRENSWHNDVAGLIRRLDGTEGDAHRPRTLASSGYALIWGLVRKLPPLDREARPGVAALLSAVLPGIGTALYFRTLTDVLISTIFALPFLVLTSTLPEQGSPSEGQQAWWFWAAWGVLAALSGAYAILRSYSSNQRLEGEGRRIQLTPQRRTDVLARRLRSLESQGWRVESQTRFEVVVAHAAPNHVLHGILTFLFIGLWAPVWITLASQGGMKRRAISVDQWGNLRTKRLERRVEATQP
jgi:hypothetical protein